MNNLPQKTVVILDLHWVHCGVFNLSLVVVTFGLLVVLLTYASISNRGETTSLPNSVLHQMS